MTKKHFLVLGARLGAALAFILFAAFPLYWMFNASLLDTSDMFQKVPKFFPTLTDAGGYAEVFGAIPILGWLQNSAFIASGTTVLSLLIALFAAYGLSRYSFRGKGLIGFALFATQMLPEALLLVPLYALFLGLGLLNSLWGLVLVDTVFVMPILVWLLKGAIDSVPLEVEEAARIDGCSRFTIQVSIVWPLILPSIAAASVLAFFHAWNEYLLASTFIVDADKRPASVGLASLIGELTTPLDQVMSAAILYTVPALVFFLIVQRRIVTGLTAGSVKG
jgi:multiple sugar transport system permease protein